MPLAATRNGTQAIDSATRGQLRPSPFIALTRQSTTTDVAIVERLDYDAETGVLEYTVHSVTLVCISSLLRRRSPSRRTIVGFREPCREGRVSIDAAA